MGDHRRQRPPPGDAGCKTEVLDDPQRAGGTVEADRAWAQNRIKGFFAGQARIWRKADAKSADDAADKKDVTEVSEEGEPAEKEADAVADEVADRLQADTGKDAKEDGAEAKDDHEGSTKKVSEKLDGVGRKVFLSKKEPKQEDPNAEAIREIEKIKTGEKATQAQIDAYNAFKAANGGRKPTRNELVNLLQKVDADKPAAEGNRTDKEFSDTAAGHKKGARGSTAEKHEEADSRRARDKGGEKGDKRRRY